MGGYTPEDVEKIIKMLKSIRPKKPKIEKTIKYMEQRYKFFNPTKDMLTYITNVGVKSNLDQELLLKEGQWSEFVPIVFELWPNVVEVKGIVRFYLKEVDPYFKLYASPINMDPSDSPLPINPMPVIAPPPVKVTPHKAYS